MVCGMKSPPVDGLQLRAICRYSAVSFIQQAIDSGKSFRASLKETAALCWEGRYYSTRTLEGWYYDHKAEGFAALQTEDRCDKGSCRALTPAQRESVLSLRRLHPKLTVTTLVGRLLKEGKLEAGTFSIQSVYRLLQREGLDRAALNAQSVLHRVQAAGGNGGAVVGPTKAWETSFPNALWMSDVMEGPCLRLSPKQVIRTYLIACIDDHSRLVPHAQFYDNAQLKNLLDCLFQAFEKRGLPNALYTDNGKVFTCNHLKLLCANLNIRLIHARPYACYSKGKIEKYFSYVRSSFLAELEIEPVKSLAELNARFSHWLEGTYHRRVHSALDGQSPIECFQKVQMRLLPENWRPLFFERLKRRVRMDATITLNGKLFETPVHLRGREVQVRIDPFAPTHIEIWFSGKMAGMATPCNKRLNNSNHGDLYAYQSRTPSNEF